jgi:hypothetical protein
MHGFRLHSAFAISSFCLVVCISMASSITSVIHTYQDRLKGLSYVPATTYGHAAIGEDGLSNKLFLAFLFADKEV